MRRSRGRGYAVDLVARCQCAEGGELVRAFTFWSSRRKEISDRLRDLDSQTLDLVDYDTLRRDALLAASV